MTTTSTLSGRDRAILRAVAAGGARTAPGQRARPVPRRPLLLRPVRRPPPLPRGLITAATLGRVGQRVAAILTPAGHHALGSYALAA